MYEKPLTTNNIKEQVMNSVAYAKKHGNSLAELNGTKFPILKSTNPKISLWSSYEIDRQVELFKSVQSTEAML